MNRKRLLCMAMTLCMAMSMAVPAAAVETTPGKVTNGTAMEDPTASSTTGQQTTLQGTIKATRINVTVPSNVPFFLDPTIDVSTDTDVDAQITAPGDAIKITNASVVPVYAKISEVETTGSILLTNDKTELTTDYKTMIGFRAADASMSFATADNWLTNGTQANTYLLNDHQGRIEAKGHTNTEAGNITDTMTLKVYGQSQQGWQAEDTFTVVPTILISVNPFD